MPLISTAYCPPPAAHYFFDTGPENADNPRDPEPQLSLALSSPFGAARNDSTPPKNRPLRSHSIISLLPYDQRRTGRAACLRQVSFGDVAPCLASLRGQHRSRTR